jgi:hypothetical protein
MKKINIVISVLFIIAFGFSSKMVCCQFRPFEQNGLYGYKNKYGKIIILPKYLMAEKFSKSGIAAVVDDSSWAYIDKKGTVLIRPVAYDNFPDEFHYGLARFEKDGKFGFFNRKCKIIIPNKLTYVSVFSNGLAAFCEECIKTKEGEYNIYKGGKWGYINKNGEITIEPVYDVGYDFEQGYASVKLKGKWLTINKKGKVINKKE